MKSFSAREGRKRQKELIASLDRKVLQLSRKVQGLQAANNGLQRCVARMESELVQADETIEILKGRALSPEAKAFASTHLIREMYEQHALRGAAAVNLLPPPQSSLLRAPLTSPLHQRLPELQESRITEIMAQTRKQNELVHHILVRGATGGNALTAASSQADPFRSYLNNGANTRTNPFALVEGISDATFRDRGLIHANELQRSVCLDEHWLQSADLERAKVVESMLTLLGRKRRRSEEAYL